MTRTMLMEDKVARMLLYGFLTNAYTYPDAAFIELIARADFWPEMRAISEALAIDISLVIDEMETDIRRYNGDKELMLKEFQVEYTYLFINAVPRVPAPPYESVYTGNGRLMGEPVSEVLKSYREAGLVLLPAGKGPDGYRVLKQVPRPGGGKSPSPSRPAARPQ